MKLCVIHFLDMRNIKLAKIYHEICDFLENMQFVVQ